MTTESEATDVRAALLFDRPVLRSSESEGAKAFLQILDLHWPRTDEGNLRESILGRAALGLKEVFSDAVAAGRDHFSVLAEANGDDEQSVLAHLLGSALLIWSMESTNNSEEIAKATSEVLEHQDTHLAGLYLLKLAGFALDSGHRDQAAELLNLTLETIPADRDRLRWRLEQFSAWLRGGVRFAPAPEQVDPLADFPWIEDSAAALGLRSLTKLAEQKVEDPWRRTMHFGLTQVDSVTAAVLQAEWAGALWLLPRLRLQQASTTLLIGGRSTEEWERAAANWVLGGGTHLREVLRTVEPHFEASSARRLIDQHMAGGLRLRRPERYIDLLLSMWDLLDAELAQSLLEGLRPSAGAPGHRDDVNALWTVLGALVPEVWTEQLARLAPEEQSALLPHLTLGLLQRVPDRALYMLTERCAEDIRLAADTGESPQADPYRAASKLLRVVGADRAAESPLLPLLREAPEGFRPDLVSDLPELGDAFGVADLLAMALRDLQGEAEKVSRGTYSMYARPPVDVAAHLAIAFSDEPTAQRIVETVAELAGDSTLMVEFRIEALRALYRLALSHSFDELIARYGGAQEFKRDPFRSEDDVAFQRALWNTSSFIASPSGTKLPVAMSESRDEDPRVRRIAVHGIGDDLDRVAQVDGIDVLLCWSAVVGAMFDPAPSVVTLSLDLIAKAGRVPDELAQVVSDRLALLFRQADRDVRSSVVRVCSRLAVGGEASDEIVAILERARHDRSWLVRDALSATH